MSSAVLLQRHGFSSCHLTREWPEDQRPFHTWDWVSKSIEIWSVTKQLEEGVCGSVIWTGDKTVLSLVASKKDKCHYSTKTGMVLVSAWTGALSGRLATNNLTEACTRETANACRLGASVFHHLDMIYWKRPGGLAEPKGGQKGIIRVLRTVFR